MKSGSISTRMFDRLGIRDASIFSLYKKSNNLIKNT